MTSLALPRLAIAGGQKGEEAHLPLLLAATMRGKSVGDLKDFGGSIDDAGAT